MSKVCKRCGYCEECGRGGGYIQYPHYPWLYPTGPVWINPNPYPITYQPYTYSTTISTSNSVSI